MTAFLLFLLYLAVLMVAIPMVVFVSVKLAVLGYHVGTQAAGEYLKKVENSRAR